jgi:hypothetical protein
MTWFETMMGFGEEDYSAVQRQVEIVDQTLRSTVNGKSYRWGALETPQLSDLRQRAQGITAPTEESTLREVVGNVQDLHCDPQNRDALFQVASQFNLLEMVGPSVTPERGVGCYEHDRTQGPACAIAAGAGTIYRNYFVEVQGQRGQTADRQVDCLADLGSALGNTDGALWQMRNGYALPSEAGLSAITTEIHSLDSAARETLLGRLRIGLQWRTEVTLTHKAERPLLVSQAYGSALPVAYTSHADSQWEAFARLVLEASYEACFAAAVVNKENTGSRKLYLTLLGGGAFGNRSEWILDAIRRAFALYGQAGLDVAMVSYGESHPDVRDLIDELK